MPALIAFSVDKAERHEGEALLSAEGYLVVSAKTLRHATSC